MNENSNDLPTLSHIGWDRLITLLGEPRGNLTNTLSFMTRWFKDWTTLSPARDIHGNFWLTIGDNPKTLFISHTDTVDPEATTLKKALTWDPALRLLGAEGAHCLGADDGAGVETLVCLAEAGVPGLYLWAANEERGASGSRGFLSTMGPLLKNIRVAISFDRRGTSEVITSQFKGDCASPECGLALAKELGGYTLGEGSFTDSAIFADCVSECLNLSIGYVKEHSPQETLDVGYLDRLVGKLLTVQWDNLPTVRIPGDFGHIRTPFGKLVDDDDDLSDMIYNYPEEVYDFIQAQGLGEDLKYYLKLVEEESYGNYGVPKVWPWD